MLYRYTIDNLLSLMQTVGTLKKEQIVRYFMHELPDYRVEYLLNQLVIKHILVFDEATECYSFVGAAHFKKETQDKLIRAFWVLVAAGSGSIQEIMIPHYPTQFLAILHTGKVFDVTVVDSPHDALLAQRIRSESLFRGVSDIVTHVALLRRADDVYMLSGCGFDNYCLVDPSIPEIGKYSPLDEN